MSSSGWGRRKQQSPERCAPGFGLRRSGPGWDTEKGKRDQKADHSGAKEIFAGDGAAAGPGLFRVPGFPRGADSQIQVDGDQHRRQHHESKIERQRHLFPHHSPPSGGPS